MSSFLPLQKYKSPHFDSVSIPVEFLVIHYTAQSLEGSLNIFLSNTSHSLPVSCHLLIGREGQIFELVSCWKGVCHRAFHAGESQWVERKHWRSFNNFSVGVELVNWNGNFYPYTEAQYQSLFRTIHHFKKLYPQLKDPNRIIGHEHIAGFRGKADPGFEFQWEKLFREVYGRDASPQRRPLISENQIKSLTPFFKKSLNDEKARAASLILESSIPFSLKKQRLKLLLNTIKV